MDFYCRSNTHDPDQEGFEDLYRCDFIHAISCVARHKLAHHHLDAYQCAAFHYSIVRHNMGEEEANPTLELAMEYASALGTIVFDESCCLQDLMEAQTLGAEGVLPSVIVTVAYATTARLFSFILLSPTLHPHSLILSSFLSYLFT